MAKTWINLSGGTVTAKNQELQSLIRNLQRDKDDCHRLLGVFAEIAGGTDWAALGVALGITALEAQAGYSNVLNADGVLQGADIRYLLTRRG